MCWWVGPQSDLMSAPSPSLGPQSDGCVPYLPLSQGQDSLCSGVAPVWATCTLPGLWCCFYGIWHISWGGSARCTGAGGAGSACFSFGDPLREGPCSTGREADPSEGWIHRGTVLGVCVVQAGLVNWFPLGFWLGDVRGRWHWPAPLFPTELSSVFQGSTPLPPGVLSPSRSPSEQSCCLLTLQMLSPTGCQNSCNPAPPLLQARLGGSALPGGLPL